MDSTVTFEHVALQTPFERLGDLASFYGGQLGLPTTDAATHASVTVGRTRLDFTGTTGDPFYHFAFLVPGNRFDAVAAWASKRVELLPDRETGEPIFDFASWEATALYFHDPAGNIVELIAHHGLGDSSAVGAFGGSELLEVSEVGVVGDPPTLAAQLDGSLGLRLWDGTLSGHDRLAFLGEKARSVILSRAGRPWLPTGRPAEAYPVEIELSGLRAGVVDLPGGGAISAH